MGFRGVIARFGVVLLLLLGLSPVDGSQFVFEQRVAKSCAESAVAIAALKSVQLQKPTEVDVVVIGAGPAGLSLGYHLKQQGLPFVILEKGESPGDSFLRMPPGQLMNPGIQVRLPGRLPHEDLGRFSRVSFQQYGHYLEAYSQFHELPVQVRVHVQQVSLLEDGRFLVSSKTGSWIARRLVNASGYFSRPIFPFVPWSKTGLPYAHSSAWPGIDEVKRISQKDSPRILVVGGGVSAGEILREIVQAGFRVDLSTRSSPRIDSGKYGLSFYLSPLVENLILHSGLGRLAERRHLGLQGRDLEDHIEKGRIQIRPAFKSFFESDEVRFEDGSVVEYDFIVFATGFRPALQHFARLPIDSRTGLPTLQDHFESAHWKNLYFLGLQDQSSAFSQYIMGIKYDARQLARQLSQEN